jgi:hypothetical protein
MGLPVLRTLSLCTCCRHYPGAAAGRTLRSASPSRISLPRKGCRVGLRIVLFEDCSAFTRVTACTLALSPIRDTLTRGFSHFVTSMTAPVASGWSVCRVGLAPTGKRRLCHGAHPTRTSIAEMGEHWTKLPMISTLDDICWIWSKRASSTSIVASLYRLAVVPFHLVQQWDRNVA